MEKNKIYISFYLDNSTIKDIDCRNIIDSNPGIGGTEYAIITISHLLSMQEKYKVTLYTLYKSDLLPTSIKSQKVKGLIEAIKLAEIDKQSILVFRHAPYKCIEELKKIRTSVKLIVWCHNFAMGRWLTIYAKHPSIARILNVGSEQLDLYRDHKAFLKSDYIYNGLDINTPPQELPIYSSRPNIVTYIGNIKREKGFHLLAQAWKRVLEEVPNAQLNVIGSGQLYDRSVKMGKYGIAESEYENYFIPYILNEKEEILPSVHFLGIMGKEKEEIIRQTRIGVPNPSGVSETFGFTAVEMQLFGCLITTKKCAGYLDTVANTGILYNDENCLAQNIITLLKKESNQYNKTFNFLRNNFSFEVVVKDWCLFLDSVMNNKGRIHPLSNENLDFEHKRLKDILRKIKNKIPGGYLLFPSVSCIQSIYSRVLCKCNKIRSTYLNYKHE